jgi:hypothetical protein
MHICCSQTQFTSACFEEDMRGVGFRELVCDDLGSVGLSNELVL